MDGHSRKHVVCTNSLILLTTACDTYYHLRFIDEETEALRVKAIHSESLPSRDFYQGGMASKLGS